MDLLAAIKREERKLENELGKLQHKLNGVRAAAKALGSKASREITEVKKRVMSAAARAKISKATKARWAKFLKGHCKTGHTGSLQKRPWEGSRNLDVVPFRSLFGQV
jgi:hypothetical protein